MTTSELKLARDRMQQAQRDFHMARIGLALGYVERANDFIGWQMAEYRYDRAKEALYACLSWAWDAQERDIDTFAQHHLVLLDETLGKRLDEVLKTVTKELRLEPSMSARRKVAA